MLSLISGQSRRTALTENFDPPDKSSEARSFKEAKQTQQIHVVLPVVHLDSLEEFGDVTLAPAHFTNIQRSSNHLH